MKFKLSFFITAFLVFLTGSLSADGFNSIHSPDGIYVMAVGDNGKIFRSASNGLYWSRYIVNPSVNYNAVHSYDNDVWIAGSNGNIYKTFKVSSPLESFNVGASISLNSVYFVNSNTGYTCGDNGKVFKSINGGLNWTDISSTIPNVKLNSISFTNENNGIVVGNNGSIFTTVNGGNSWFTETSPTSNNLLKVNHYSNGFAVVGEYGTILTKQVAGAWESIQSRTVSDIRGVTGFNLNNIVVCGGGGFIRNNKNGVSNFFNFEINPMQGDLQDIFYYDNNNGFAVSKFHEVIIITTNGGTSWDFTGGVNKTVTWENKLSSSGGIGNNLCPHPTDRNRMYVAYGNKVYESTNRAETWTQIATITGAGFTNGRAHSFYVNPLDTNIWLAAIDNVSPDRVVRSTNYGATWTSILSLNFSNYGQPLEQDQNNPNNYYFAPDGGGFYRSTDMGATFQEISGNYPFRSPCDIIVEWDNSNVIFVADGVTGAGLADIFRTSNNGINWTKVHTVSSGSEIPSMCNTVFDPMMTYATTWSSSQIYRSTNGGINWPILWSTGASGWASDVCHEDPTVVLTGSYSTPAFLSTNNGASWTQYSPGGTGAGQIFMERDYALDMRTSALYKMKFTYSSFLTDISGNTAYNIPDKFELYQNYPNPFNPSTVIKFDLPEAGNVTLKVYNQLGREVRTLVNSHKDPGSYEINFNALDLSSGIYYYRIEANNLIVSKKMLLVK